MTIFFFFGGGGGLGIFVNNLLGVTSNFDNFYGLFFEINYSNLCSL